MRMRRMTTTLFAAVYGFSVYDDDDMFFQCVGFSVYAFCLDAFFPTQRVGVNKGVSLSTTVSVRYLV